MEYQKHIGGFNMSCHGNEKEKQGHHGHNPLKHMLHMVLCCGLPLLIVSFLPAISRMSPNASIYVSKIVPFLCPLMMVFMFFSMARGQKKGSCCDNSANTSNNSQAGQLDRPTE
jgi:hypothetical protein